MPANTTRVLPAIPNGTAGQDLVDAVNDRLRRIVLTDAKSGAAAPSAPVAPAKPVPPGPSGGAPYTATVTALTTLTVTAATHGKGLWAVASCFDDATPAKNVAVEWTRAASGDIVFTWGEAFTGTVQIN